MPTRTVKRERLVNKLRDLGYKFKRQGDRVDLYKRAGDYQFASVPRRDLLDEDHVRCQLRQAGCKPDEIERFIANECH